MLRQSVIILTVLWWFCTGRGLGNARLPRHFATIFRLRSPPRGANRQPPFSRLALIADALFTCTADAAAARREGFYMSRNAS